MESTANALAKKPRPFAVPWTVTGAILRGNWATRLTMLIMGFGNLVHGQILKGLAFLGIQALFIFYLIQKGLEDLSMLPSLGWLEQVEQWNEAKGIYEYVAGHRSVQLLLWGVVACAVIIVFFFFWRSSLKSAYKAELLSKAGEEVNTGTEDLRSLLDGNIHNFLLTLPVAGVLIFTILPLIYMITMAFTNYSRLDDHLVLFDWVGLDNFVTVLNMDSFIGQSFWPILGWTVIWAILATGLNFMLGLGLAMMIGRKQTRFKSLWRVLFSFTIAIPQFVSLLTIRTLLQENGALNTLLVHDFQWFSSALPFWQDPTWARVTVIVINLWVGIPYTLLQVTGILQNFPEEYNEAARIDGAGPFRIFYRITLPYILFIMSPYLITQFTTNINNFNVIYLLTGGGPARGMNEASGGYTDLLVTWLYKLTIDQEYYNIGAVIGIFTFAVLSIVALVTYRSSGSYKDEEGFQ